MNTLEKERVAAVLEDTAQVMQVLLTSTRGGARPPASLLDKARRLQTEFLAVVEALEADQRGADAQS